jgi:hypothetical protein
VGRSVIVVWFYLVKSSFALREMNRCNNNERENNLYNISLGIPGKFIIDIAAVVTKLPALIGGMTADCAGNLK